MDVISDVIRMWISDVKIYPQILHGCDPGCDFRLQIFLRCDSACDFWHAWRERALRAPKILHEFDTHHFDASSLPAKASSRLVNEKNQNFNGFWS